MRRRYAGFFTCHSCQSIAVHRRARLDRILRFIAEQGKMHDCHEYEWAWTR